MPDPDVPAVSRAEFDELVNLVRGVLRFFHEHRHDLDEIDGGGRTRDIARFSSDYVSALNERLDDMQGLRFGDDRKF